MKRSVRHILLLFCLMGLSGLAYGQQGLFFSQYIQDAMVFNPAYAGAKEALTFTAQYRLQWLHTEGAPAYQSFSAHAPVWSHNIGLGLRLTNDQLAGYDQQTVSPVFSYRIRLGANRFIAAGLQAGLLRQRPDFRHIHLRDPDDPVFQSGRAGLSASFGTGVFYGSDRFYAGLAIPSLFPDVGREFVQIGFREEPRTYIGHAGLVLDLNADLKLKPNVLIALPERGSLYADANLHLLIREVLWLGGSYRLNQGVAFSTQLQLNPQLSLGYSYDVPLQQQLYVGAPSHEVSVQYRFFFVKSGIKSPRYF